jgi:hypothetical protein
MTGRYWVSDPSTPRPVVNQAAGHSQVGEIADVGLNTGKERMSSGSIESALGYPSFCRPDQAAGGWNIIAAREEFLKVALHAGIVSQILWASLCFEREIDVTYSVLASHQTPEDPDLFHVSDRIGVMIEQIDTSQEIVQHRLRPGERYPSCHPSTGKSLTLFGDRSFVLEFDQSSIKAFFEYDGAITAERENGFEVDEISR